MACQKPEQASEMLSEVADLIAKELGGLMDRVTERTALPSDIVINVVIEQAHCMRTWMQAVSFLHEDVDEDDSPFSEN